MLSDQRFRERVKEESRDLRGTRCLEELWQDLRYGGRMLLKRPGFTLFAVTALALGIGANTAIFSVLMAVLMRPLPFKEPEALIYLWNTNQALGVSQAYFKSSDLAHAAKRDGGETGARRRAMAPHQTITD